MTGKKLGMPVDNGGPRTQEQIEQVWLSLERMAATIEDPETRERNLVEWRNCYQAAFGRPPPAMIQIAVETAKRRRAHPTRRRTTIDALIAGGALEV